MSLDDAFKELKEIYDSMPKTTCLKSECSNWCCSKLPEAVDENGVFMPLPLVYGVEFLNILKYLRKKSTSQPHEIYDFSKSTTLCPFKDKDSTNCSIYEVRPYSCRVYGRKVPPVFWGVEVPYEQAKAIFCKDVRIDEAEKQIQFIQDYPGIWSKLAKLSFKYSPFTPWQKNIFETKIGSKDILVFAFGEFYFLTGQSYEWYTQYFKDYWEVMGNKL